MKRIFVAAALTGMAVSQSSSATSNSSAAAIPTVYYGDAPTSSSTASVSSNAGSSLLWSGSTSSWSGSATTSDPITSSPTSISWYPSGTVTVTYTLWDPECGCHKTTTAIGPVGSGTKSANTYTWWDTECGCHKTAAVPALPTIGTNYTAPVQPPAAPATPSQEPPPPTESSSAPAEYTNNAGRVAGSLLGAVGMFALLLTL